MTRRLSAIVAVIAVALLAAFWFVGWSPATRTLQKTHAKEVTANAQTTQLRAQVASLLKAEKNAPLYESQLNALKQAVPDDPSFASVIDELTQAAASSGVQVPTVSPSISTTSGSGTTASGAAASGPAQLGLALSVSGTYTQILAFITDLEKQTRIFVINTVNLSGGGGPSASQKLTASINGDVYYANASAEPGSGGTQ